MPRKLVSIISVKELTESCYVGHAKWGTLPTFLNAVYVALLFEDRKMMGWIGIDLDGTLAHYEKWQGVEHIGEPIPAMLERIAEWIEKGQPLKIVTARVYCGESGGDPIGDRYRDAQIARTVIEKWCLKHLGVILPVTCCKDFGMIELWDDRCIRIITNTGEKCCGS